ncbi:hypothetical protein [Glaciecola petra]|uniref:Uncharacterized protein n=1 Tax=Glaciecola petra TaxID=3075602 RepID=A0ABU2ZSI8_9ALTE|nr:hypothetical protein [Aestuariibacter sp. P117]MDT0594998.1 hypothetical protein [Aestuariibacter sp. P117]
MKQLLSKTTLISVVSLAFTLNVYAFEGPRPHEKRKPPKEAYEACVNKEEGEIVTIETPRGDLINATCIILEEELVARPEKRPKEDRE